MNIDTTANPFESGNDENERMAIEECVKRQRLDQCVSVLVMNTGRCELAAKFAQLGARVTIADHASLKRSIEGRILAVGLRDNISFSTCELAKLPDTLPGEPFDIIVLHRGLSTLPYNEARSIVRQLMFKLRIGGKLYLSTLGLHSELGEGYAAQDEPVDQRFAALSPVLAKKYDIHDEICLYTERNLFMLLLEAGASVLRTMTTTYGNVKGVAVRV
jgi:hypothetical protein